MADGNSNKVLELFFDRECMTNLSAKVTAIGCELYLDVCASCSAASL